ncbi:MAG: carbohydrate ABC transporter permease [Caldilinea sp.]|nr:carbohydrate ABC transporter permease [Caldilinea sp.]MCO5209415.1 carbohydrate ABC transporter permease [Caldilinea sp.]MCW5843603.1 carbohydrate ABC transporter permease [Caldilinea sp.]
MADSVAATRPPARSPAARPQFTRYLGTYLILAIGAAVAIVPFLYTVSVSLMNLTEANGGAWLPGNPQWGNYIQAWNQANFSQYFWNSVRIAAITISGEIVFCTLAAYAFARMEFWGKNLLFSLLLATLMLPEAITWVPNFITVSWLGRVGPVPWINNWPALTVPFMASAFSIFLLRQFFMQVPNDLWDSAQIDGAGHIRYLVRIMIPLSKAAIMTLVLFGFISSWNALAWPILVTTTPEWRPISYGFYAFIDEAGAQFNLQMAGSVITMTPVILLYFFTQKTFIEGIATSGLKG